MVLIFVMAFGPTEDLFLGGQNTGTQSLQWPWGYRMKSLMIKILASAGEAITCMELIQMMGLTEGTYGA
jgi:hypothetical protein